MSKRDRTKTTFKKGKYPRTPVVPRDPPIHAMADIRLHRQCLSPHALDPYYHHRSKVRDVSEHQYDHDRKVRVHANAIKGSWREAGLSGCRFDKHKYAAVKRRLDALKPQG